MESCKDMTQHRKRLNKESFMIEKGEEPRSSAVKMKIRAKKIDRQREKWRNIKGNQGFAAGCGSTSKIEICEKCCPRLDIGRRILSAERHQAVAGKLCGCAREPDRGNDRIVAEYKMEHYNPKIDPTIRSKFIEGETVPAIMPHYERNAIHDY